jgi:hypothetical protein
MRKEEERERTSSNSCPIDSAYITEIRSSKVEGTAEKQYCVSSMIDFPEATPMTIIIANGEHITVQIDVPEFKDAIVGYDELLVHISLSRTSFH